jgi:hypothetical protein
MTLEEPQLFYTVESTQELPVAGREPNAEFLLGGSNLSLTGTALKRTLRIGSNLR